jgi:hypothetical protein
MARVSITLSSVLLLCGAVLVSACSSYRTDSYRTDRTDNFGNTIPGTNAIVGPGPKGEEWHKDHRD